MQELTTFLKTQKVLQIAPNAGAPWIANVLMGCEHPQKIYFIGSQKTLYGQKLLADPRLAFATAWVDAGNHCDRKGIQGVGTAVLTEDDSEIEVGVRLHNQNYPEFADRITPEWIRTNEKGSGVWAIRPEFIKYWSDEDYGTDGSKQFDFS